MSARAIGAGLRRALPCAALVLLALALRLLVWNWHRLYDLSGDEREYFNQALTLLQQHRYVELNLMRPPLYTGFLAVCIRLVDSLVQRLRLIQEIIGALTVLPAYLLTLRLFGDRRAALAGGLLVAANYTLAANATELLTETLFVGGLTILFWLMLRAAEGTRAWVWAGLAGLNIGALTLLRSVALPLLPLAALWLLLDRAMFQRPWRGLRARLPGRLRWLAAASLICGAALLVAPWTLRNYLRYGAPILVDTTGAENLWLDNDPAGREAVKRTLYEMKDDRAGRQQLAFQRGVAAISANPAVFLNKAWGEAKKFFALEYFDDMRERRAIWLPPLEVWLRLILGDGGWLLLLLGGVAGMCLAPGATAPANAQRAPLDPRWVFVPWALYIFLTALLFHVELRYRLPLYPALLPYAAWLLVRLGRWRAGIARRAPQLALAALVAALIGGLLLLHRPYISEAWMLANKHLRIAQAERALARGDASSAQAAGQAAQGWDPESALAQVALARSALLQNDRQRAQAALERAIALLPDHPLAHLLRGALLRAEGQPDAARADLAYESHSRQDLQGWAWQAFTPFAPAPAQLQIGAGLDLGYLRGFQQTEPAGFRWTGAQSELLLAAPSGAQQIELELAGDRPSGAPAATVAVLANDQPIGQLHVQPGWHSYRLPLSASAGPLRISLRSSTFSPRDYDRASPDDRTLGVMLRSAAIVVP